ncbi:DUF3800 domain-containing protein [Streptomyces sp. CB01881]|uniref:DUF3800 domain-containing protein n=1 Tax=Streptomyces sp. CB01881 TaxID=2078691 RepID=UPI0013868D98|nr:DUF3800 domain-containing protein [Streptomyces sp. CB01881]
MHQQPVDRHFYLDDSGAHDQGIWLYAWMGVPASDEARFVDEIDAFRAGLLAEYGIPVEFELHATKFLTGHGRPGGKELAPMHRKHIAQHMLDLLDAQPDLSVGAVFAHRPLRYRRLMNEAFTGTLRRIDAQLEAAREYGRLVIDGDGTNPLYQAVFDEVRPARITGLGFAPAHESQLIQFADLVAYTAFQRLLRAPRRAFMHHWYPTHLAKAHGPERV